MIVLENGEFINIHKVLFTQKEKWSNVVKWRLIFPHNSKLISDDDYKKILKYFGCLNTNAIN